eukprot:2686326-Pyramimonas_sp.AAC.1
MRQGTRWVSEGISWTPSGIQLVSCGFLWIPDGVPLVPFGFPWVSCPSGCNTCPLESYGYPQEPDGRPSDS